MFGFFAAIFTFRELNYTVIMLKLCNVTTNVSSAVCFIATIYKVAARVCYIKTPFLEILNFLSNHLINYVASRSPFFHMDFCCCRTS